MNSKQRVLQRSYPMQLVSALRFSLAFRGYENAFVPGSGHAERHREEAHASISDEEVDGDNAVDAFFSIHFLLTEFLNAILF